MRPHLSAAALTMAWQASSSETSAWKTIVSAPLARQVAAVSSASALLRV